MTNPKSSKIKVLVWNATSLLNKMGELKFFLKKNSIDVALITETWLKNNKTTFIKGYKCYRQDRPQDPSFTRTPGGGVAIFIKTSLSHQIVLTPTTIHSLECKIVKITMTNNTKSINIVAAYNKPTSTLVPQEIEDILKTSTKVIIAGDLNAKHSEWNCITNNTNGNILKNYIDNSISIIKYPPTPTFFPDQSNYSPSTIDLAIIKNINTSDLKALPNLPSNHAPVIFYIEEEISKSNEQLMPNYAEANWKLFKYELNKNIILPPILETVNDINKAVDNITTLIQNASKAAIPLRKQRTIEDNLPDNIKILISQRNHIRKKWQQSRSDQLRILKNHLSNKVRLLINNHKNEAWQSKLEKLSTQDNSLWTKLKVIKRKQVEIPPLIKNNSYICTDAEKAELMAETFAKIHSSNDNISNTRTEKTVKAKINDFFKTQENQIETIKLTKPREITKIIRKLKNRKAPGTDRIRNIELKHLPRKAIVYLTYVLNACIQNSYFPKKWKTALILPIHKAGKANEDPNSYRPISLLTSLSKILEKVILRRIIDFSEHANIFQNEQFGFRQRHSTIHQLVRVTELISKGFNKKRSTAAVFLDIQKAFDTVWHDGLFYKLIQLGIPKYLIKFIKSYLAERKFQVIINDSLSNPYEITAGVPQGSILGPILFNIYLHDLPRSKDIELALFADDTAIIATGKKPASIINKLQRALRQMYKYYTKWKIKINANKCQAVYYTHLRNKPHSCLHYNYIPIEWNPSAQYLGLTIDSKLTWKEHVYNTTKKSKRIMHEIYSLINTNSRLSTKNKLLLYNTVIRPVLTYGSTAWCSVSRSYLNNIQIIQNKCLRMATKLRKYNRICHVHEVAAQPTIEEHIIKTATKFYDKCRSHENPLINQLGQYDFKELPKRHRRRFPKHVLH